jgi:hypothetical protein
MNEDQTIRAGLDRHWQLQTRMISRRSTRFIATMQCLSARSPGSESAVDAIFKRLVLRSGTRSALGRDAYSVLPTLGSLNSFLRTTACHLKR